MAEERARADLERVQLRIDHLRWRATDHQIGRCALMHRLRRQADALEVELARALLGRLPRPRGRQLRAVASAGRDD